jgi:hypothetical protein
MEIPTTKGIGLRTIEHRRLGPRTDHKTKSLDAYNRVVTLRLEDIWEDWIVIKGYRSKGHRTPHQRLPSLISPP